MWCERTRFSAHAPGVPSHRMKETTKGELRGRRVKGDSRGPRRPVGGQEPVTLRGECWGPVADGKTRLGAAATRPLGIVALTPLLPFYVDSPLSLLSFCHSPRRGLGPWDWNPLWRCFLWGCGVGGLGGVFSGKVVGGTPRGWRQDP